MPTLLSVLLALLAVVPAAAQVLSPSNSGDSHARTARPDAPGPTIHVTDRINRHPAARAALDAFAASPKPLRALGKSGTTYAVGQTQSFKVYNVEASRKSAGLQLDRISFTLVSRDERFRLWVETAELDNGHVLEENVDAIHTALSRRTPDGSVAPESGILANDASLFGTPPDVDGDGATDVLLVDIRDGYEPGAGYVAGFVWHGDLDPRSPQGNGRDVLYIDTYPGIYRDDAPRSTTRAEATAAHEFQHLIHLAFDPDELTFVNEGLSEWAETANGYAGRSVSYLTRPGAHTVGLLDWHDDDPALRRDDYERARLFTSYLAQRVGPDALQQLVDARSAGKPLVGAKGYRALLAETGIALEELVADFHTTNFVNDRAIDPRYGYVDQVHDVLPIVPTQSVDGRDRLNSAAGDLTLRPGGVSYLSWRHVADFQFRTGAGKNSSYVRIRAVAERTDGRTEVLEFSPSERIRTVTGDFKRLTLVLIHAVPDAEPASLSVDAVWKEGGTSGIRFETVAYDDGRAEAFFSLSGGADAAQATRFVVPESAALGSVSVAPYFANQFPGTYLADDEPRDLEVRIWDAARDGSPGRVMLSIPVTDPRSYREVSRTLSFFDVDLAPYESALSAFPDTVFVGLVDAGDDANHLVAAVSAYPEESISYTGNVAAGTWKPLWDVQLVGGDPDPMRGTAIPIRAEFVLMGVSPSDRGESELPAAVSLEQNYPNPFNPTSTIRYHLEEASTVRLAVYDLSGRRVALLAEGLRSAGSHEVPVDARSWASGVYVYALQAGERREMRKMVLAK